MPDASSRHTTENGKPVWQFNDLHDMDVSRTSRIDLHTSRRAKLGSRLCALGGRLVARARTVGARVDPTSADLTDPSRSHRGI